MLASVAAPLSFVSLIVGDVETIELLVSAGSLPRGALVGTNDSLGAVDSDGAELGPLLGTAIALGVEEGDDEGRREKEGLDEGASLGLDDGDEDGATLGELLGVQEGLLDGVPLGRRLLDGSGLGSCDGC